MSRGEVNLSHSIAVQVSAWGLFNFLISGRCRVRGPLKVVFLGCRLARGSGLSNFSN